MLCTDSARNTSRKERGSFCLPQLGNERLHRCHNHFNYTYLHINGGMREASAPPLLWLFFTALPSLKRGNSSLRNTPSPCCWLSIAAATQRHTEEEKKFQSESNSSLLLTRRRKGLVISRRVLDSGNDFLLLSVLVVVHRNMNPQITRPFLLFLNLPNSLTTFSLRLAVR